MLKSKRSRNVYVLVTLDEGQFAVGERPTVSVYRTLRAARVAMAEDIKITMNNRGYSDDDIIREVDCDFAMTNDERYSWSIEEEVIR